MKSITCAVAASIVILCFGAGSITAGTLSFNFSSGIDPNYWTDSSVHGELYTVTIASDGATISKPATTGAPILTCRGFTFTPQIVGDFDAQLRFSGASLQLVNYNIGNFLQLGAWYGSDTNPFWSRLGCEYKYNGEQPAYSTWSNKDGIEGLNGTSDTSGGLRIVRAGSVVTAYRLDQDGWTSFYSDPNWTTDFNKLGFNLMNNQTTDAIAGTFQSFTITNSAVPEPSAIVLLCIGAGSLWAYAWQRRR